MKHYKFEYLSSTEGYYKLIELLEEWVKDRPSVGIQSVSHSCYQGVYSAIITYY